jgi:HSP20 family protein
MDIRDLIPRRSGRGGSISGREGEDPFRALQTEINRAFETFWRVFPRPSGRAMPFEASGLRVDVSETDKEIEISAELPGLDENDIDVSLTEDVLTIKGEKKTEKEEKKKDYYISERSHGAFRRSIPLPAGTDRDRVRATFKNGVLSITIPKTEEAQQQVRRIKVGKS